MSSQKFLYWIQDNIKTELIVYKYDYAIKKYTHFERKCWTPNFSDLYFPSLGPVSNRLQHSANLAVCQSGMSHGFQLAGITCW